MRGVNNVKKVFGLWRAVSPCHGSCMDRKFAPLRAMYPRVHQLAESQGSLHGEALAKAGFEMLVHRCGGDEH
jgi:hypothetical protein